MFDFEEYKNQIIDKIDELNESVKSLHEDEKGDTDLEEEKEADQKPEEDATEVSEMQILDDIEPNITLEDIHQDNLDIIMQLEKMNQSNVEGFWLVSLSVIIVISLKIFMDNITKW